MIDYRMKVWKVKLNAASTFLANLGKEFQQAVEKENRLESARTGS